MKQNDKVEISVSPADFILGGIPRKIDGKIGTVNGGYFYGIYADPSRKLVMVEVDGERFGLHKSSLKRTR